MKKKKKNIDYGKWGLLFILPFFIAYLIFSLIPLIDTVRYSFFEYYRSGIKVVGPNFVGMKNYISLLKSDMFLYGKNTLILWLIGFVPQIVVALVLACWPAGKYKCNHDLRNKTDQPQDQCVFSIQEHI